MRIIFAHFCLVPMVMAFLASPCPHPLRLHTPMFPNYYTHNLPGKAMTKDRGIGSLGPWIIPRIRLMQLVGLMTAFDQA
jgi:hypothetical protein